MRSRKVKNHVFSSSEVVVIQSRGTGATETFTIRKMSGEVGVERIFPINMPAIQKN